MFWKKCGNAGNYQICGISRTIAGWLTPMHSPPTLTILCPIVTDLPFSELFIRTLARNCIRPCSHVFRFAFRSRSGPVPLVRVAFTPAKIDRDRSGCGPVTRSHLFRNATGTHTISTPTPRSVIDEDGLLSMDRYDVNCPNFGLERNFGR